MVQTLTYHVEFRIEFGRNSTSKSSKEAYFMEHATNDELALKQSWELAKSVGRKYIEDLKFNYANVQIRSIKKPNNEYIPIRALAPDYMNEENGFITVKAEKKSSNLKHTAGESLVTRL